MQEKANIETIQMFELEIAKFKQQNRNVISVQNSRTQQNLQPERISISSKNILTLQPLQIQKVAASERFKTEGSSIDNSPDYNSDSFRLMDMNQSTPRNLNTKKSLQFRSLQDKVYLSSNKITEDNKITPMKSSLSYNRRLSKAQFSIVQTQIQFFLKKQKQNLSCDLIKEEQTAPYLDFDSKTTSEKKKQTQKPTNISLSERSHQQSSPDEANKFKATKTSLFKLTRPTLYKSLTPRIKMQQLEQYSIFHDKEKSLVSSKFSLQSQRMKIHPQISMIK